LGQSVGKTRVGHPSPENMSQCRVFGPEARCTCSRQPNCGANPYDMANAGKVTLLLQRSIKLHPTDSLGPKK